MNVLTLKHSKFLANFALYKIQLPIHPPMGCIPHTPILYIYQLN